MADHTPERIVSLQPSATVILEAVGELRRVVACTKYCADLVPSIKSQRHAILADSWTANAEQIMAAHPDLVIASVPYQEKAVIEILEVWRALFGVCSQNAGRCLRGYRHHLRNGRSKRSRRRHNRQNAGAN
jgi:ABC-type hemin transport system substrate-binding protein